MLSDFTGLTRAAQSYLANVARHSEVLAVQLNDPFERELPPPGRYRLVASRSGRAAPLWESDVLVIEDAPVVLAAVDLRGIK